MCRDWWIFQHHRTVLDALRPQVTVILHDTIDTKGLPSGCAALRDRVHENHRSAGEEQLKREAS